MLHTSAIWAGAHLVLSRFCAGRRAAEKYHWNGLAGILLNSLIGRRVWATWADRNDW